ncbi:YybH family protein [Croceicoccus bisphenolivorans]|uniref:YybH family protein n=1 Tax=Croceicoccus bisphenolivorans TaxID=1783232 RepID=UPI00083240B4|nr:SgcJ/EcaC family oxidoreductase [Croceicoccus bisphenolivorans]
MFRSKHLIVPAIAPFLILAACNQEPPAAPAVDTAAEIDAIKQVQAAQEAAFASDDAEGATAIYASNATFAGGGMPVLHGIEAIRGGFDAMIADKASSVQIAMADGWVSASGDYATTISNYTYTHTGPDGAVQSEAGFNQSLWHKEEGTWKLLVDSNTAVVSDAAADPEGADAAT